MYYDSEIILEDDYKVFGDYLYIVDGIITRSDVFGTVRDLKRDTGGKEVRSCDVTKRLLMAIGDKV